MYIEKEHCESSICNNFTGDSSSSSSMEISLNDENTERWQWLIKEWDNMTFKERMLLFMPYLHYVNPRDYYKHEFDERFGAEMVETAYRTCRTFNHFHFDPDGQGVPNIIMVFNPVDVSAIPDLITRTKVREWGKKYGFVKCECQNCRKTSEE